MKVTYRIPTKEPFAFVEIEGDTEVVEPKTVRELYDELTKAFQDGAGIEPKAFAEIVLEYCTTGHIEGGGEWYESASAGQKGILNELKKLIRSKN